MINLQNCSRKDLIRIIAKMKNEVGHFLSSSIEHDDETCVLLNHIGSQAIKECDTIGWNIKEKPKKPERPKGQIIKEIPYHF